MPNRASELSWDEPPSDRSGLSRRRIVEAALELADAEGLDAVSIRRVATALRARPMSLYSHIASKDDLVALMFDAISAELLVPEPLPDDWREAMRLIARRAHDAYLAHPWMLHALGRRPPAGPNQLRRGEQSASAVAALGLDPADAWTALRIVHDWTMGHALHVLTLREDRALSNRLAEADPDELPAFARAFRAGAARTPEEELELGLDAVLDGIEARLLGR